MDNQTETTKKERRLFPMQLASKYITDYEAAANEFPEDKKIELVEHLLECLDIIEEYFEKDMDKVIWKKYADKEAVFLKKHGTRLKEYSRLNFFIYYDITICLVEKGIVTHEEFNSMAGEEEQSLSLAELKSFFWACRNALHHEEKRLLLQVEPEDEKKSKEQEGALAGKEKRGKVKREANDKHTCLNMEQTAQLIYYFQKERAFLQDELLSDKDAGAAFEILTGYSKHTLRQTLGKFAGRTNNENLKEIDLLLNRVKKLIDIDLKTK